MKNALIDLPQLTELVGHRPALLVRLGTVFLEQLPGWLSEFEQQMQVGDAERLARLLHKMKGSCHAICASGVAREFESAEQSLALAIESQKALQSSTLEWHGEGLVARLHEVKAEFSLIISQNQSGL
jgi:HPt (histidine-containing phosphotransfer) domain-containing protein